MKPAISSLLLALVALPLVSGCATSYSKWYGTTPDGIRHTRMMVHSDQTYFYPSDPVPRSTYASYPRRETPLEWLSRVFNIPAR